MPLIAPEPLPVIRKERRNGQLTVLHGRARSSERPRRSTDEAMSKGTSLATLQAERTLAAVKSRSPS